MMMMENLVWKKNFGGTDTDYFNSITNTPDGGFVAVGFSYPNSFGNGDWTGISGKGNYDATIVKYDADGNVLWQKNFGGSDVDQFLFYYFCTGWRFFSCRKFFI